MELTADNAVHLIHFGFCFGFGYIPVLSPALSYSHLSNLILPNFTGIQSLTMYDYRCHSRTTHYYVYYASRARVTISRAYRRGRHPTRPISLQSQCQLCDARDARDRSVSCRSCRTYIEASGGGRQNRTCIVRSP